MYTKTHLVSTVAFLCLVGVATSSSAQSDAPKVPSTTALTIYNENFAVVRNTLPLLLKPGKNHITYSKITDQLQPDSVTLRDPNGHQKLTILDQNYLGETVSVGLLLSLNEGKTIDFQVPDMNGGPPTIVEGKIIRSGYVPVGPSVFWQRFSPMSLPTSPVIEVDGKMIFTLPGKPLFPLLADDTILKPTLDWTILTDKGGPVNAELAYITNGLTWKAAYNVVAPAVGSKVDITGLVTIDNESGTEFDNAKIKLMAGDVNIVRPASPYPADFILREQRRDLNGADMLVDAVEKQLDEYHLYTLPNATTLHNHETKQVEFLQKPNVNSKDKYVYDGVFLDQNLYSNWSYENIRNDQTFGTLYNPKVAIERDIENTAANGLGVPLPAGIVRYYRRDSSGQLEFIGENDIDHTPKGEPIKIVTGNAFDIDGSRIQTDYTTNYQQNSTTESFSITLENHKTSPVEVTVLEHLYRSANWTITAHSDPFVKKDSNTINFVIKVPAVSSKTITYTAHYSW